MNNLIKYIFIFPIKLYRIFLSPLLGVNKCRYNPTCSQYMIDAIMEWGILRGVFMGLRRIGRC
ncbi:MAG: membrane protein insertion efficiency factor YidD, partial [Saprospiraceae bacterium]|nr:membrane protein insertion efficiency factor YidD [Saprospiraceae bacterium]